MLNFFLNSFNFKKGQGLSIETIIVIIILIIVLVVILLIFSDQSSSIFNTVKQFLGIANESTPQNLTNLIK